MSKKRLVIGLGGKGGTGKTLHFRSLYYFLIRSGLKTVGFDADIENPGFYDHHAGSEHPVRLLDFLEVGEAKGLFTVLAEEAPDVVLIDMPGASAEATRDQLNRFGAFAISEKLGYRVTFSSVLNNQFSPIVSVKAMLEYGGGKADFLAVKSLMWAQGSLDFRRWDESQVRKDFLAQKGIEIEMPVLEPTTFDAIHEEGLSFFEMEKLPFGDQILAESFLDQCRPELEKAAEYLGLPPTIADLDAAKPKAKRTTKKEKEPATVAATAATEGGNNAG
ncbi:hypothetical protein ACQ4M4_11400 [Leptolyngbya sp. AN02str]|uniref:hypothetical protein n=1 Tax=Leptolyngbya sp. AN02str TaxID=3423363 RepID=UPI003D31EF5C